MPTADDVEYRSDRSARYGDVSIRDLCRIGPVDWFRLIEDDDPVIWNQKFPLNNPSFELLSSLSRGAVAQSVERPSKGPVSVQLF